MKTRTSLVGKIRISQTKIIQRKYNQQGYTYIVVLAALVIVGVLMQVGTTSSQYLKQRDKEAELIFRGLAYKQAIEQYYFAKKNQPMYPRNLRELEKDSRFINKKHIRKLYLDPITKEDWQIIRASDGGIAGVASTSRDEPLKKSNFKLGLEEFEDAKSYSEWLFEFKPKVKLYVKQPKLKNGLTQK